MQKSVLFMGLGYIGLPTAALVADAGLQVTGVDINENVVNNINNCDISNQEPGLQEIVEKNIRNGRLKASLTPSPSDVFLIVVPTPFNEHHQRHILCHCRNTSDYPLLKERRPIYSRIDLSRRYHSKNGTTDFQ